MLQDNRKEARSVLLRILKIGGAVGVTVGLAAFASKSLVSGVFTKDALVSEQVQRVMPLVALFMVSSPALNVLCCCQKCVQSSLLDRELALESSIQHYQKKQFLVWTMLQHTGVHPFMSVSCS